MRKIIAFSFIACTLSSSTTFCMLKHVLRTQKYIRGYQTTPFFQLPPGNIFNTPKKDLTQEKTAAFLEDLWNRNGNFARLLDKQGTLLEKQNDIVVAYMSGHNEHLDVDTLNVLEKQLQATFPENFLNKGKGHANE
ncbi:MAG TPA: hypothetical protein VJJ26_03625 [Candidatus Babeliales bacterium]|nr:hypothetical protein [Candidatus Babeliales bacterium]